MIRFMVRGKGERIPRHVWCTYGVYLVYRTRTGEGGEGAGWGHRGPTSFVTSCPRRSISCVLQPSVSETLGGTAHSRQLPQKQSSHDSELWQVCLP